VAPELTAAYAVEHVALPSAVERVALPSVVERVTLPGEMERVALPVPERTRCRWSARLAAAARVLVVLLAASGGFILESVAAQVGLDASRAELVQAYAEQTDVPRGAQLAVVAALTHRLERGIRLM
jgi:hypothetical protein